MITVRYIRSLPLQYDTELIDVGAELHRSRCQAVAMIICIIGIALLVLETAFSD